MAAPSTEYLRRKPYVSSVLLCTVLFVCFGFICDYKYESVVRGRKFESNGSAKPLTEVQNVKLFRKKRENTEHEPLVFIYNKFWDAPDWYSHWDNVEGSKLKRTLKYCPTKCLFTSDPNFLESADFVLVSLASYKYYWGQHV